MDIGDLSTTHQVSLKLDEKINGQIKSSNSLQRLVVKDRVTSDYWMMKKSRHLPGLVVPVSSQDHVECILADHGCSHLDEAVSGLLQQQGTAQVRLLQYINHTVCNISFISVRQPNDLLRPFCLDPMSCQRHTQWSVPSFHCLLWAVNNGRFTPAETSSADVLFQCLNKASETLYSHRQLLHLPC